MKVTVDGVEQSEKAIPLVDDGKEHKVEVWGCRNTLKGTRTLICGVYPGEGRGCAVRLASEHFEQPRCPSYSMFDCKKYFSDLVENCRKKCLLKTPTKRQAW